jgi:hypothetical protein
LDRQTSNTTKKFKGRALDSVLTADELRELGISFKNGNSNHTWVYFKVPDFTTKNSKSRAPNSVLTAGQLKELGFSVEK